MVEKIKAKLQEEDPDLCQKWEESKSDNGSGSGINYSSFHRSPDVIR